ncbi:MAG: hypothetical protein ACXADH_10425 [Candidatus Kariarchaeaceae archaeon]|jgi:hypothetical protein
MPIQYVWYGKYKEDKAMDSINWWRNEENIKRYKELLTEGMKFIGMFITIEGTADHDWELWLELDNWGVLDKNRGNKELNQFMKESFFDKFGFANDWMKTKAFRTATDVRHAFLDA